MRLADAIYQWSFTSLTASSGARAFYDYRRAAGDTHHAALRHLGNRLVGILHGCLIHHTAYDERTTWGHALRSNYHGPLDTSSRGISLDKARLDSSSQGPDV
jgi:hypothetical protein